MTPLNINPYDSSDLETLREWIRILLELNRLQEQMIFARNESMDLMRQLSNEQREQIALLKQKAELLDRLIDHYQNAVDLQNRTN